MPNDFVISRTLNAPRERVWNAWTKEDELKKWFGPKGTKIAASTLELKPGGIYHYGMEMPGGSMMWGKWIFRDIVPQQKLVTEASFSDKDQNITRHPFAPNWPMQTLSTTTFEDQGGKTLLTLRWATLNATPDEQAAFDAAHEGMKQGWGGTFEQLENYLATS